MHPSKAGKELENYVSRPAIAKQCYPFLPVPTRCSGAIRLLTQARPSWVILRLEGTMAVEDVADAINSLTPEEQESVRQFIEFLKGRGSCPSSPFLAAVDEFIDQHRELLRRLAQ